MKIKCPYCGCIEYTVIGREDINHRTRKISYDCAFCRKQWSEIKGELRGRYYWHNGDYRRIPETAKVIALGGVNVWSNRTE